MKKFTLAIAVSALFSFSVFATVRHVDYVNGADSGDGTGTGASAWKTLAYAVSNADANDEIILATGTHMLSGEVTVDINKALDIHGAGTKSETILDANHAKYTIKLTAADAKLSKITFYRLGSKYHNEIVQMTAAAEISDCDFTSCMNLTGNNTTLLKVSAGLVNDCWFTNNLAYYNAGINLSGSGIVDNCVFMNNSGSNDGAMLNIQNGNTIVRNCTIVNNIVRNNAGAVYTYCWQGTTKLYNCIIWGNTSSDGAEVRNWSGGTARMKKWSYNCTTPSGFQGTGNIYDDPVLDADWLHLTSSSPLVVKNGQAGNDADGIAYATENDIEGTARGATPSMGAFKYVAAAGMVVNVRTVDSVTEARLPSTIGLYCEVESAAGALTYEWDFDNDGTVDSTEATPSLATVGTYSNLKVTVSDGSSTKSATYNGTLTILPKFLDVTLSADKTAIRYPGIITLSAAITDSVTAPLTYSWDLDGDGVEDSTAANPQLTVIGSYVNPKLLRVEDADGKYSDVVTLAGTYTILPAEASTFYVATNGNDNAEGTIGAPWKTLAKAVSSAFDDDVVILGKGTHTIPKAGIVINRPVHFRGAGENWETILDANHQIVDNNTAHIKITANGAELSNVTLYRLCGGTYHNKGMFVVTGNSVVSNCVFTSSGNSTGGDNRLLISMQAGVLDSCWITNNVCRCNPMVSIEGKVATECRNCVIADNRVMLESYGNGLFNVNTGLSVVRNCTVVNNCVYGKFCGMGVHYPSGAANADVNPKIYNCIVFGNTNTAGQVRNVYFRKWYVNNFIFNNTTGTMIGEDNVEYALNSKQGYAYVGKECVTFEPHLNETYGLTAEADATLKTGAKTGNDGGSVAYCMPYDIYGNPRGDTPSMGAIQYVAASTLSATIQAPATSARLPETITLTVAVEGAASENITYAWDIDGDGNTDAMTASVVLDAEGVYDNISVTVSDGTGNVTATYDGTITILEELLDVTIVPSADVVRQPGSLTFSASVANTYVGPLTYSWDTDGDDVADYSGAVVTYSAVGIYSAPKLISIVDANGKHNDNITLAGSFGVHPVDDQVYYVDYANGSDDDDGSAAHPFKTLKHVVDLPNLDAGDEIILKRGTHTVAAAVNVKRGVHVHGEGEKEETVLDANNVKPVNFTVSAAGALLNNLTFYRFGHNGNNGWVRLYGDSVVSNVVVTGCGVSDSVGKIVDMSAGRFCNSWVTNNIAGQNAGVSMTGNSILENCAILNNRSTAWQNADGGAISFPHGTGHRMVRNCTIANNTFGNSNRAVYGYCWDASVESVRFYNNIVWNNQQEGGAVSNCVNGAAQQKWFVKNNCWNYDRSDRLQDPNKGTAYGSVFADPQFQEVKGAPWLKRTSPCYNAGWDGAYAEGELDHATDLVGNHRKASKHVDVGCFEIGPSGMRLMMK